MAHENGASAVEFAILLPVIVTLVFGIVEFSILFYNKAMLTNASREGARAGIVYIGSTDTSEDLIKSEISPIIDNYLGSALITFGSDPGKHELTIECPGGTCTRGDPLTVTISYTYEFLVLPNFITALSSGFGLNAVTIMRME